MGVSAHTADDQREQSASVVLGRTAEDALYDGALTALLGQVARPPSLLDRIWLALRTFHARRRDDEERLPVEYWLRMM
jgi:hypothetical protein